MTDKQKILWTYLQKDAAAGATGLAAAAAAAPKAILEGTKTVGEPVVKSIADMYVWALKKLIVPMLLLGPPAAGALAGIAHTKLTSPTKESEQAKLREIEARELAKVLAAVRRKKQLAQQKQEKVPDVGKSLYI